MKKDTTITFDEVMAELDKYRVPKVNQIILTSQQREFLIKCRIGEQKVPYDVIVSLWIKMGWGEIKIGGIRRRIDTILELK